MGRLNVNLCGIGLENPVIAASGTFGYGQEFSELFDLNLLGGISIKGTTLHARDGNPLPRIAEVPGGMLNAVGLQNPGAETVVDEELPRLAKHYQKPVMANISGFSVEEYAETAEILASSEQVGWLEVNISCPNVHGGGMSFGTDPKQAAAVTAAVRRVTEKPVLMKLSPNVTDIAEMAKAAEAARWVVENNGCVVLPENSKDELRVAVMRALFYITFPEREIDAPLLDYLHSDDELERVRRIMQEFYQPVKICDQYLRFCFITGITKFSHLSIFSTLNNLRNISMEQAYSSICGITARELDTTFAPDVQLMAERNGCSVEEMRAKLKLKYDGYRFCIGGEDIYNPFSLTSALRSGNLENYWFSSGTPTFLFRQMQRFGTDILSLDRLEASAEDFDVPTESMQTILPLLYQSGYLTIKEAADGIYTLDYPNAEVRVGFMKNFLQQVMHITVGTGSTVIKVYHRLAAHDIDGAMGLLRSFFAGIPYLDRGEGALDADGRLYEQHFEQLMYVIFSLFNDRVRTQVKSACGRSDIVMRMPDATYVMEIKLDGSAAEALRQIGGKGYAVPYEADGRVVKIGVNFSSKTRTIENWQVEGGW